tara:strand:- start:5162 stop:5584 length:423 start_codon:yes stop_codon:yes gene_type:complete
MIAYHILSFIVLVIGASVLIGYLGDTSSISPIPGITSKAVLEGFEGNDGSIKVLNDNISEKVTDLNDNLRMEKYRRGYAETVELCEDYLESLKLSCLLELSKIEPEKDSESVIVEKCKSFAEKINAYSSAVKAVKTIKLY